MDTETNTEVTNENSSPNKVQLFFTNLGIKLLLTLIWIYKNIFVLLGITAGIVFVILLCTGIEDNAVVDIISTTGLLGLAAYLLLGKSETIELSDIKSRSLKLRLIKAGLYFNDDGDLAKRIEKSTNTDIDGDGMIGEETVEENRRRVGGIFTRLIRSFRELKVIWTANFNGESSVAEQINTIIVNAELNTAIDPMIEDTPEEPETITERTEPVYSEEQTSEDTTVINLETPEKVITRANPKKAKRTLRRKISDFFKAFKVALKSFKEADSVIEPKAKDAKEPENIEEQNNEPEIVALPEAKVLTSAPIKAIKDETILTKTDVVIQQKSKSINDILDSMK